VLDEIVTVLEGRAETSGVRLSRRGRGGRVLVDPRRIKEALLNLTANAIEATPRGGSVELRHDVVDQVARLVISDTGPGMSADVAARVGTPFFTTRAGGTGLGVVIARNVIVQHGGTLDFSPRPGGGTNATIVLPPHRPLFPEVMHG
jgi:signal transduction histidine kinase